MPAAARRAEPVQTESTHFVFEARSPRPERNQSSVTRVLVPMPPGTMRISESCTSSMRSVTTMMPWLFVTMPPRSDTERISYPSSLDRTSAGPNASSVSKSSNITIDIVFMVSLFSCLSYKDKTQSAFLSIFTFQRQQKSPGFPELSRTEHGTANSRTDNSNPKKSIQVS